MCGLVSVGRPLWREDGSPICSVITQWSESRRTRNHTLLSHRRLTELGGPGSRIYISRKRVAQLYIWWGEVRCYFTTDSQSVCLGIEQPCRTCDQILLPVGMLLSEICGLVSVGCPLWREDGSAICSAITQWSESRWTRNHALLSHLRLPQPRAPGSRIYILQEQGGPVIPPGTWLEDIRMCFRLKLKGRWHIHCWACYAPKKKRRP
jgi:hypothetical protein